MKIIRTDNFAREHIADQLIAENVNLYYGKLLVYFLNEKFSGGNSEDFFNLVEDGYVLWRGMEELI